MCIHQRLLPRAHLVVNIGLTWVTPGRQVSVAEDQWVSRAFMVPDHMGIDVTAAVDLRLGSECWAGISTHLWFVTGPTSAPSPFSAAYLVARQTHPILLKCSTVLTRLAHIQACFRDGAYCLQMGAPEQWCHSIKRGLGGGVEGTWPRWVKRSKLGTYLPIICPCVMCSYLEAQMGKRRKPQFHPLPELTWSMSPKACIGIESSRS